jgi:hypothetical protein
MRGLGVVIELERAHDLLAAAGMSVRVAGSTALVIDGRAYEVKVRARPSPSDLRREHERLARRRPAPRLMHVAPRIPRGSLRLIPISA